MRLDYTRICVVVDASGSMESIKGDVQGALKRFCADQRKAAAKGEKIAVDLYQFSNDVERLAREASLDELERYADNYHTIANTALYDGVCTAIDELGASLAATPEPERPEDVLFVIVTDGYENASRRFNAPMTKERIKRQTEAYSWKFIFLANGIDLDQVTEDLGIERKNAVQFSRKRALEDVGEAMYCCMDCIREERLERRASSEL